jgi:hypothetical protein
MPDKFKPWEDLKTWEDMSQSEKMKSLRWDVQRIFATLHDLTERVSRIESGHQSELVGRVRQHAIKVPDDEEEN